MRRTREETKGSDPLNLLPLQGLLRRTEIIERTGAGAARTVACKDVPPVLSAGAQGGSGGCAAGVDGHYIAACGDVSNSADVRRGSAGSIPAHGDRVATQRRSRAARRARTQAGRRNEHGAGGLEK